MLSIGDLVSFPEQHGSEVVTLRGRVAGLGIEVATGLFIVKVAGRDEWFVREGLHVLAEGDTLGW